MLKRTASSHEFLSILAKSAVEVDQWQLEKLALVAENFEILFYTPGLPEEYHPWLWGKAFGKVQDAVNALSASLPAGATVALMPEGPYVLAKAEARELVGAGV